MPINNIIKLRRGNATDWSAINGGDGPTLNAGEPGFEIDSNILKIGDGSTAWKDLKPIGADQSLYKVKNTSGGIIHKGQVVRANGTVGNSDAIQVTLFIADGSVPEYTIMGLATQDMNNNDFGYVTAFGQIRGIDTAPDGLSTNICAAGETWVDGDILYASPSASGKLTKNIPQHETIVAIVLNAADNGSLFVRPTWYPHLADLHDVDSSGATNNQYLRYDSNTQLWTPTSSGIFTGVNVSGIITATGGNSTNWNTAYGWGNHASAGYVDGAGSANHIAYWSDSNTLTFDNSKLYWDSTNNRLGVGTSSPSYYVDIYNGGFGGRSNLRLAGSSNSIVLDTNNEGSSTAGPIIEFGTTSDSDAFLEIGHIKTAGSSSSLLGLSWNVVDTKDQDFLIKSNLDGDIFFYDYESSKIGIFTEDPSYTFEVNGTGNFINDLYVGGNVGIGTASPSGKLHVEATGINLMVGPINSWTNGGKLRVYGDDTDNQNQAIKAFVSRASAGLNICLNGTSYTIAGGGSGTNIGMYAYAGNGNKNYAFYGDAGYNYFADRVGIGTLDPQVLLHVNGQAYLQSLALTGGTADRILATDTNKNVVYLNTTTYPSLTELSYVKGVTSAIQTQINLKAPLASPTFTGTPAAPTATSGTNTTQLATTAFVRTEISNLVASAPSALDTLNELAAALGNDANFSTTVTTSIGTKVAKAGDTMTGALGIPLGSNGSPSLFFSGDTNTGFYSSGADTIDLVTGGNRRLTVASDGDVGIGTTNPGSKLEVNGEIAAGGTSAFTFAGNSWGYDKIIFRKDVNNKITSDASGNYNWLVAGRNWTLSDVGNVGIGTATPSDKLNVIGNISAGTLSTTQGKFIAYGSSSQPNLLFEGFGADGTARISTNSSSNRQLKIENDGASTVLGVYIEGDVGIGTTTPSYKLQVNGSFGATTKSFRIDHPSRPNYTLEYGSLESPYHGVRLTGRGVVVKGSGVVQLPSYLKDLIHNDENINIQITNIKHGKTIYVDEISLNNDQFTVKVDRAKTLGDLEFFWTFTGTRKDVDQLVVEQEK